ncbi:hypothetical protein GALL_525300 [mine drainage metagenome]|uniref:Uncharacterized protein n=1 Tax=mine drainage metagenome TaxID=410659 RepID=A0A1J5PKU1_9ZZZZ
MLGAACDAEDPLTTFAHFDPDRATMAGAMDDFVRDAAQRNHRARKKRCRLWQPAEARGNPATMALREILGVGDGAAWRHRQDRFALARMNAQRIATRAPMAAQPNRVDLRAMLDEKARRFVRPPIKKGASGHVCDSGDQEFARILPYPPPVKSLGAKTNHLPNIQGLAAQAALQDGPGTKKIRPKTTRSGPSRIEIKLILSGAWNRGFRGPIQGVTRP